MKKIKFDDSKVGLISWFDECHYVDHPILKLMPYRVNENDELYELQEQVAVVLDEGQETQNRLKAVESARSIAHRIRYLCDSKDQLASNLYSVLENQIDDKQVIFYRIRSELESLNYKIVFKNSVEYYQTHAKLTKDDKHLSLGRSLPHSIKNSLRSFVSDLEEMSDGELSKLGSLTCISCITALCLFVQYVYDRDFGSRERMPFNLYYLTVVKNIWQSLISGIDFESKSDLVDFERRFGLSAYNRLRHELIIPNEDIFYKSNSNEDIDSASALEPSLSRDASKGFVVIRDNIAPSRDSDDNATIKRFSILQGPLPVAQLGTVERLEKTEEKLISEFPWASNVVCEIMQDLIVRKRFGATDVGLQPVLLLGPPGVGKTRLLRRISEEIDMAFLPINLAGVDDSRLILGTARGWSSGQPSPILEKLVSHNTSSVVVMFDEIEKTTNRSSNSASTTSMLLGLLEIESAARWYDHFLQVQCDLSKLIFVAAANSLIGIPKPLLSRLKILHIDSPKPSEMVKAIPHILSDIEKEWCILPGVLPFVDADYIHFKFGNLRELKISIINYLRAWAKVNITSKNLH